MEGRKQAISIRIGAAELRNVKKLSRRLGVRYSDVIRFAIKSTLARLAPLTDPDARGRELVPVFLESGNDMLRYLDLDESRLENIINDAAADGERVDHGDIQLLVCGGQPNSYARFRLTQISGTPMSAEAPLSESTADQSLRSYFFQKYVFQPRAVPRAAGSAETQS